MAEAAESRAQAGSRAGPTTRYAFAALNLVVVVVVSAIMYHYEARHTQRWEIINEFHFSGAHHAHVAAGELQTLEDELRAAAAPKPSDESEALEQSIQRRLALLSDARQVLAGLQEKYQRPQFHRIIADIDTAYEQLFMAFGLPDSGRRDDAAVNAAAGLRRKLQNLETLNLEAGKRMAGEEDAYRATVEWSLLVLFAVLAGMAAYVSIIILRRLQTASGHATDAVARLQKTSARLDAFFSGAPAGLAIVDRELRCEKWNETLIRMGGREPNQRGCRIVDLLPEEPARSIELAMRDSLATGKPFHNLEFGVPAKPGESGIRRWLWSHFPISAGGGTPEGLGLVVTDVSELKDVEEMLRAERNLNAAILDTANALVVVLDSAGGIVRFNRACEVLTGYAAHEMIGGFVWDKLLQEKDIEPVRQVFRNIATDGIVSEHENAWLTKSGEARLIWWNNSVIPDEAGKARFVVSIGIDVTDQRAAERRLTQLAESFANAQRIGRIGNWDWDAATRKEWWSDEIYRILGLEAGTITARLEAFMERVHPDDRADVAAAIGTAQEAKACYDTVFRILRPDGEERVVRETGEAIVNDRGELAGLSGTVQDVTEQHRAEQSVAAMAHRLAVAQRIASLGSWEWDPETDALTCSDEAYSMCGLETGSPLFNEAYLSMLLPQYRDTVRAKMHEALASKTPYTIEYRLRHKDGEIRTILEHAEIITDNAAGRRLLRGTIQDITARKEAERALAQTAENLAHAQRIARLGSWDWDIVNDQESWSDECYRIHGLEPGSEELSGYKFLDFVHPEDRDAVREAHERTLAGGKPLNMEFRLVGGDGIERVIQTYGEVTLDDSGRPVRMTGTVQDITDRKKAEMDLRQSEQRFQLAFQLSPGMTAISEIETGAHIDVNDKWIEVLGHSRDEAVGRTSLELGVWNDPDDRARAVALLHKDGRFRDFETQFRTKTGELREMVISAEKFPVGGKPHMLIVGHDITERKLMERALRDSEQLFRGVFDQAAVGIAQVLPEGRIVKVNGKLAEILGYPVDELQALHFHDITHPDDLEAEIRNDERLLAGEIPFYTMEKRYVRGDAGIVWASLTTSLVRSADGTPQYLIGVVEDIEDRKRAEARLRETAENLETAQRIAKLGSWSWDIAEDKEWWSDETYRIVGLEPGSVVLDGREFLEYVHPDDRERIREANDRSLREGVPYDVEYRLIRTDGAEIIVSEFGAMEYDAEGNPVRMRGTAQDVTELRRAEAASRESNRYLDLFFKHSQTSFVLMDGDFNFIRVNDAYGKADEREPDFFPGKNHFDIYPSEAKALFEEVRNSGKPYQAVAMPFEYSEHPERGRTWWDWTLNPVAGADGATELMALSLNNVTERVRAEQALQESEALFRGAFDQAAVGILLTEADGRFRRANPKICEILGYSEEELYGMAYPDVTHPDDMRESDDAHVELSKSKVRSVPLEKRYVRKDGTVIWARTTISYMRDEEGNHLGNITLIEDIDDRKKAEQALSDTLHSLAEAQRIGQIGSWELDAASGAIVWSDENYRLFGLDPESVTPDFESLIEMIHPGDRKAMRARNHKAMTNGVVDPIEFRFVRPDGDIRLLRSHGEVVHDRDGSVLALRGTVQDITERKQAELALQDAKERLEEAQRLAHVGHWEWNPHSGISIWSEENYRIFGLMPDSEGRPPAHDAFMKFVHDDDRAALERAMQKTLRTGEPYMMDFRVVGADGEVRTVFERAERFVREGGDQPGLRGVLQDVTELRQMEADLSESEARLSAFFSEAPAGLGIIDSDCRYVQLNETLARMSGLPVEEHIGKRPSDFMPPEAAAFVENAMRRTLDGEAIDNEEGSAPGPDGRMRHWVFSQFPISGDPKKPDALGIVVVDITDLKAAQRKSTKLADNLAEAQRMVHLGSWDWSPEEDIEWWSDELYRIFGLKPGSVILDGFDFLQYVHPDDRERVEKIERAAAHTGEAFSVEYRVVWPDGTERIVAERGEMERDAEGRPQWRGTVQDVTEQKAIERKLRETMRNLEESQRIAKLGSWVWDIEKDEEWWSDEIYRIRGMEIQSKVESGYEYLDYMHPDDRKHVSAALDKALKEDVPYVAEYRIRHADGHEIVLSEHAETEHDKSGKPIRMRGTTQDVTDRKHIEQELARLNRELEQRVEERTAELKEAQAELVKRERLATLGQLTATVSHELRNPLGAMRTSMYIVEKKTEGREDGVTRAIDRVNRNITRCDQIIDELLDYTRIRDLEMRALQIDDWLDIVLDEQPVPDGIAVRRKFGAPDLRVPADSDRLRRAVINIYDNACHALTGPATGDKSCGKKWMSIETHVKKDRLEIVFSDNGPGIPDDIRERVFEPLFSTKNFGVGLGLPTVRQIMEQHGGGVVVSHRRGGGAKFALWLPLAREAEATGV